MKAAQRSVSNWDVFCAALPDSAFHARRCQWRGNSWSLEAKELSQFLNTKYTCGFVLEYNDLKSELKDYLKRFADEGTVC